MAHYLVIFNRVYFLFDYLHYFMTSDVKNYLKHYYHLQSYLQGLDLIIKLVIDQLVMIQH